MVHREPVTVVILAMLVAGAALGGTNYFDEMMGFPKWEQRAAYVHSLDAAAVWILASEAVERGWDDYAVGAGILEVYFGSTWETNPPSEQELLCVITNTNLHPRLRASFAASSMRYAQSWAFEAFLRYVDTSLAILEDRENASLSIEKIPEHAYRHLKAKMESLTEGEAVPPDKRGQADEILRRVTRVMDYLASAITDAPAKSQDPEYLLRYACSHLSEYVGWCLLAPFPRTQEAGRTLEAARKGQGALGRVLTDRNYAPAVARVVLRQSEKSRLQEVLSEQAITEIRQDNRFADDEDQQLLDALSERTRQ